MARKVLIRSANHPYHITGRCNNREQFYCGIENAWKIFGEQFKELEEQFGIKIHAFVLMPNHFHLLLSSPRVSVDIIMHRLMLFTTKAINLKSGRTGRVFGGRYHWSLVTSDHHFDYVSKYVYRNPVKAKICERVEDYPYSTLRSLITNEKLLFSISPVEGQLLIPHGDVQSYLWWLNQPFRNEQDEAIGRGLKKATFNPAKKGWERKSIYFEPIRSHGERAT